MEHVKVLIKHIYEHLQMYDNGFGNTVLCRYS